MIHFCRVRFETLLGDFRFSSSLGNLILFFSGSSLLVYLIYFCLHKIRDYVLISVFIMKWSLRITIFSKCPKARRNTETLKCKHILYVYFSDFYFSICLYSFCHVCPLGPCVRIPKRTNKHLHFNTHWHTQTHRHKYVRLTLAEMCHGCCCSVTV